jgi:hypothetical protein
VKQDVLVITVRLPKNNIDTEPDYKAIVLASQIKKETITYTTEINFDDYVEFLRVWYKLLSKTQSMCNSRSYPDNKYI